jgi:hypothetical protein
MPTFTKIASRGLRATVLALIAIGLVIAVAVAAAGPAYALQPSGDADVRDSGEAADPSAPATPAPQAAPEPDPPVETQAAPEPDPRVEHPVPTPDTASATPTPDPRVTNPGPATADAPVPASEEPQPTEAAAGGPHASAPTANLRKLANALVVTKNSPTVEVSAPAGLDVGIVEISILFGADRLTRNYNNTSGSRFEVHAPPGDGTVRQDNLDITLTERNPGGPHHYSILSSVSIAPLFTVTVSPLTVNAFGSSCDLVGYADPTIFWVDPAGVPHRYDLSSAIGEISAFGGTWTDVSTSSGLTMPTLEWVDRDPGGFGSIGENALPRGAALLPLPGYLPQTDSIKYPFNDRYADAGGDSDCFADLSYTVTLDAAQ